MKRIAIFLVVLFAAFESLSAQATMELKVNYDVNGREVEKEAGPEYCPEAGIVRVKILVSKYGSVLDAVIDSTATTVWNKDQLDETIQASYRTHFKKDTSSTDSLLGAISYITRRLNPEQLDSLRTEMLAEMAEKVREIYPATTKPLFKLYPTDNMWNFIELDTISGMLWQVQFSVDKDSKKYRFKTALDLSDKRIGTSNADTIIPGRYELYKTQNTYNFILLDTIEGYTWQVQWSTDYDKRGVIPIY